tara:strand:- start:282 stop:548 length:267 start_codon:yes stop_codon:yes gene_type:complete
MRKHTITVYTNDEYSLYEILREVRSEIDRKVFDRDNIRQRKFSGTWEEEVTSTSPLADRYGYRYETVAKWESVVVPNKEFIKFQKETK